jgi:hypothetical protein
MDKTCGQCGKTFNSKGTKCSACVKKAQREKSKLMIEQVAPLTTATNEEVAEFVEKQRPSSKPLTDRLEETREERLARRMKETGSTITVKVGQPGGHLVEIPAKYETQDIDYAVQWIHEEALRQETLRRGSHR